MSDEHGQAEVRWLCPECGDVWVDDEPGNQETPRCCNDAGEDHSSGPDRMGVLMEKLEAPLRGRGEASC